jgi:hypothetical protein
MNNKKAAPALPEKFFYNLTGIPNMTEGKKYQIIGSEHGDVLGRIYIVKDDTGVDRRLVSSCFHDYKKLEIPDDVPVLPPRKDEGVELGFGDDGSEVADANIDIRAAARAKNVSSSPLDTYGGNNTAIGTTNEFRVHGGVKSTVAAFERSFAKLKLDMDALEQSGAANEPINTLRLKIIGVRNTIAQLGDCYEAMKAENK